MGVGQTSQAYCCIRCQVARSSTKKMKPRMQKTESGCYFRWGGEKVTPRQWGSTCQFLREMSKVDGIAKSLCKGPVWRYIQFIRRLRRKPVWLEMSEQRRLADYSSREAVEGCFQMTQSHIYLGKNCGFFNLSGDLSSVEGAMEGLEQW